MSFIRPIRVIWSLLVSATALHLASAAPFRPSTPLPPSQDPWYSAPYGFEMAAPGEVLRIRPAPGNITAISGASAVWNILYRTTDSQYDPAWAVTTLYVPPANMSSTSASPPALLSFGAFYDSAWVDASPSYAVYSASGWSALSALMSPALLEAGWFVNVPDYEGPKASFTAGVMSGHAMLDSVRAVLSLATQVGLAPPSAYASADFSAITDVPYALYGYSGGALAAEWALELAVQYAPELRIAGAALGGLTPNVTSVLLAIEGAEYAGLAPASILGVASQYPAVKAAVLTHLRPNGTAYNESAFLAADHMTIDEAIEAYAFQDMGNYFVGGLAAFLADRTIMAATYKEGIMGYHGVPQAPLLVYKAIADEVSPVADTDKLVAEYCGLGANILYTRNTVGGHDAEEYNGAPAAMAWLAAVLGGTYNETYPTVGCTVQDVTVNITDSSL